ncbi:peptidase M24 [Natronosalvus vescus]|uniref:peptidase M24 n=1 Tax=Natronosalvus vescus TaxID=2953881 RepID=UPI0020916156|nr:peptidase M24 [Natronosalvus vescus]
MTGRDSQPHQSDSTRSKGGLREHVSTGIEAALEERDASAFVHAGPPTDPDVRYCVLAADALTEFGSVIVDENDETVLENPCLAVAFDGNSWAIEAVSRRELAAGATHPASRLADTLEAGRRLLTPATIPHDAALYLERAGFDLASSGVLAQLRAAKTGFERHHLETAQWAVRAGLERAESMLERATVSDETSEDVDSVGSESETPQSVQRSLSLAGEPLTASRLREAIESAIAEAGARPVSTIISPSGAIPTSEPVVVAATAKTPTGYHGHLARTFVVAPAGGAERRAHVALTHAFRSIRSKLTADDHAVRALEADLEAEIRAFGFDESDSIDTRVSGIGLEPREYPLGGGDDTCIGSSLRVDAAVGTGDERVRLADVLCRTTDGAHWLVPTSRSLVPEK